MNKRKINIKKPKKEIKNAAAEKYINCKEKFTRGIQRQF